MNISDWIARPIVKRTIWLVCGLLLLSFLIIILCRGVIMRAYVDSKIHKVEQRYNLEVEYSKLKFSGLSTIYISGLSVVPQGCDTLLSANNISVEFSPLSLLLGRINLRYLESNGLNVQFVKSDSSSNYDFVYPVRDSVSVVDSTQVKDGLKLDYSRQADNIFDAIFGLLPQKASLKDLRVGYRNGEYALAISVSDFNMKDDRFRSEIMIYEPGDTVCWVAEGELNDSDRNAKLRLYAKDKPHLTLPFLPFRWGAEVTFDTLSFNLLQQPRSSGVATMSGFASVSGLALQHKDISPEKVVLDQGTFDYKVNIGGNFVELDSATTVCFNRLIFNPYLLVESKTDWRIMASVNKQMFPADDLFSSLPKGLFSNLEGIQTEGMLSYHMLFDVDMSQVDSLKLESRLKRDGFRIKEFGATDLRRMESPFTYTAYDDGVAIRSFELCETNPNFRPLSAISPLLKMAVMQSEDGAFFNHNGFLIDCLRDAIIEDIKKRKFVRGGSTISMQLVKNVFLSRHKTIARKVEEALIVWLIEENRLTSKERMFEVYMNIIEWGPMVYGAEEAARYYFDKPASDLDINESIFLAGIVPSPKRALGIFTDSLTLKPYMEGYFNLLAQRLVIKGLISQEQADAVRPEVILKGAAREALINRSGTAIIEKCPEDELSLGHSLAGS